MSTDKVTVHFMRLRDRARAPLRASVAATGYDLSACLEPPGYLDVGAGPVRVPTGIAVEAPLGCDVQLRPRSGLSAEGVLCVFGTLDADYRGEIFVTLYSVGRRSPYRIQDGDRIAQLVVARSLEVAWDEGERLSDTERGERGHGSTGR